MAADYFQDITPANDSRPPRRGQQRPTIETDDDTVEVPAVPQRSIRNVTPPRQRPAGRSAEPTGPGSPPISPRGRKGNKPSWYIWGISGVAIFVLVMGGLLALRPTVVTVTPKTKPITFDPAAKFIAYPADTALVGDLAYSVKTLDLEDSEVVPSQGTTHVETKASGTVTVSNDTGSTVKLVKTTRFESPDGLIFRTPADISIASKKSVQVTIVADQAGAQYNIPASTKFTIPGLKSSPDMFAHVFATADRAMAGGFSGDQPSADAGAVEAARSAIRGRLEAKVRAAAVSDDTSMTFPDLINIQYEDAPNTSEAAGSMRIHQKIHAMMPVFQGPALARVVANAFMVESTAEDIILRPDAGLKASLADQSVTIGGSPISISFSGTAVLIWKINPVDVANALAGKEQGAFQGVINGFVGIQEAHARVEPFWSKKFPARAADIQVDVVESTATK